MDKRKMTPQERYAEKYRRQYKLDCITRTEQDIIQKLDSVPNKAGYIKQLIRADIAANNSKKKEKELKRMTYYYDEKTKTNRLDCHYPIIDEKAIKEIVENSLARYIYIYIYNENNVIVNHWSYEVKHGGFHTYEDPEIETKKRIKKHVATLKRYIEESYAKYIVNAEKITQEKIRYELKNYFNLSPRTVDEMPDWKATSIWKQGPEKYQECLEDEEEYAMREYENQIKKEKELTK